MRQARLGFGECDHPPADSRDLLAQGEIEPFDQGRIDLPALLGQALIDLGSRPEDHPLDETDPATAATLLDDLRIE